MALNNSGEGSSRESEVRLGRELPGDADPDPLQQRLAEVDVPSSPRFPAPPDLKFTPPALSKKAFDRAFPGTRKIDMTGAPETGAGGSHLGAGLVIGITFPACIIVGAVIGIWIDKHYNHTGTPWATIGMTLVGIAAGLMNVFRAMTLMTGSKNKSGNGD